MGYLTKDDYFKKKEEFFKEQDKIRTKNEKLFKDGEPDEKKYDMDYMQLNINESDNIYGYNIDEVIEEMQAVKKDFSIEQIGPLSSFCIDAEAYANYGDSVEIESINMKIEYYRPMNDNQFQNKSRERYRRYLGKLIKPEGTQEYSSPTVNCKAIEMYENDELTYKGLQKMTYGTCEV